jgi:hypothetical protein
MRGDDNDCFRLSHFLTQLFQVAMGGVFLRSDNIRLDKNRSSQENENTLVLGTADGAIKKNKNHEFEEGVQCQ